MSDLRTRLEELGGDLARQGVPPAASVRRRADRRTRRYRVTAAIGGAAVAAGLLGQSGLLSATGDGVRTSPTQSALQAPPPAVTTAVEQPWLSPPWQVVSTGPAQVPGGGGDADPFCGVGSRTQRYPVIEQRLKQDDASVSIYRVSTPSFADAASVFKWLYAACSARGPVTEADGRAGPDWYWQTNAGARPTAGAALWSNARVFLIAAALPPGAAPATMADLVDTLDERTRLACTPADAGKACAP